MSDKRVKIIYMKTINKSCFGKLKDGTAIYKYTIKKGATQISVLNLGAAVQSLVFDGKDVVLGYDSAQEYFDNDGFLGATIGRCANRISNGKFTLGGKEYSLNKNDGTNTLHGGNVGFDKRVWLLKNGGDDFLIFEYFSPDGEENFPANLWVTAEFVVSENSLKIIYRAHSDGDTPVNITNHAYFNLDGGGSIVDHQLEIVADKFIPLNQSFAPYGAIESVINSPYDFTKPKTVGKDIASDHAQIKIAGGYDQYFIANGNGQRRVATLSSGASKLKMSVYTNCEGLQFYSGNFLTARPGKNGRTIDYRGGLCLETHGYPNAINCKNFIQSVLKKGETYCAETEFVFEKFDQTKFI